MTAEVDMGCVIRTRQRLALPGLCVVLLLAHAGIVWAAAKPAGAERLPVPQAVVVGEAERLVDDLFKAELAKTSPADRLAWRGSSASRSRRASAAPPTRPPPITSCYAGPAA